MASAVPGWPDQLTRLFVPFPAASMPAVGGLGALSPVGNASAEFARSIDRETAVWSRVIREAAI